MAQITYKKGPMPAAQGTAVDVEELARKLGVEGWNVTVNGVPAGASATLTDGDIVVFQVQARLG